MCLKRSKRVSVQYGCSQKQRPSGATGPASSSVVMELSDAAGDDSMGNWQGWIFSEEQQQGGPKSLNILGRLIHQTPCWAVLSLNSPGTPAIPRLLPASTASPFHPHTPPLSPPPFQFIFYKGKNNPGASTEIFSSTPIDFDKKKKAQNRREVED